MDVTRADALKAVHEVLVGGVWTPIVIGSYYEDDEGNARYKEISHADVCVRVKAVDGFKGNTLRGKLEGE